MGLGSVLSNNQSTPGGSDAGCRARFARYFPRLFAYVHSAVRDEVRARDIVADAFAAAYARYARSGDEEFCIWLFSGARNALQSGGFTPASDGLSSRERDVVSLLFDAQLTRREVGVLLSISEDAVANTLLKALRKLREAKTSQQVPWALRTT